MENMEQTINKETVEGTTEISSGQTADNSKKVEEAGMAVAEKAMANIEHVENQTVSNAEAVNLQGKGGKDVAASFSGLPIESLICAPILAAAKGQQELTAVYLDGIMKLAYKDGVAPQNGKSAKTNAINLTVQRPVTTPDGKVSTQDVSINAPLLSLVPLPAFTMDELTVDFEMEVKQSDIKENQTKSDISNTLSYKSWYGLDANITGTVSSESTHKRETDSTATYKIHARAVQQQPSEGMAKLTSLFAQMMEPIPAQTK